MTRLPVAAGLACVLALRPRRRGTPQRQAPVIQTQIILAVVGAVVMLVVGASLARAFGIVGAAGLVRYRAKIEDPKDAGVMLSTLAVGLASGVGVCGCWRCSRPSSSWRAVDHRIVRAEGDAVVHVEGQGEGSGGDQAEARAAADAAPAGVRAAGDVAGGDSHYEVRVPLDRKTDRLSDMIMKLDPENATAVEWEEKKEKK